MNSRGLFGRRAMTRPPRYARAAAAAPISEGSDDE